MLRQDNATSACMERNMSLLLILAVIVIAYSVYIGFTARDGNESIPKILGCVFCVLIGIGINLGLKSWALSPYYNYTRAESKGELRIYSIGGIGQSVHGNFVLGFGSVQSGPVYYAYTKAKDGAWLLKEFSGTLPIYEDASDDTAMFHRTYAYTKCEQKRPIPLWINVLWPVHCWGMDSHEFGSLHVPAGTIRKEFKL